MNDTTSVAEQQESITVRELDARLEHAGILIEMMHLLIRDKRRGRLTSGNGGALSIRHKHEVGGSAISSAMVLVGHFDKVMYEVDLAAGRMSVFHSDVPTKVHAVDLGNTVLGVGQLKSAIAKIYLES